MNHFNIKMNLIFILLSTLLTFTFSNNVTSYDYDFYPLTSPVCLDVPIQKRINTMIFQEKSTHFGNESCVPASPTCRIGIEDCCGFYDCLERNCGCGAEGYPLGYGKKYCQIFSNYPFSGNGNRWRDATLRCLQRSLIPFSQCPPTDCSLLKTKAFDSHPFCYSHSGVCFLSPKDLLGILAITYGDVLTLDGIQQILDTFRKCGLKYMLELELEIVASACKLDEVLRKLILDLWRNYNVLPNWIYSSSVWNLKSENEESETWTLRLSLFHLDETILPDQRYEQLFSSASELIRFTNSKEHKNEISSLAPESIISIQAKFSDNTILVSKSSYTEISFVLIFAILFIYI